MRIIHVFRRSHRGVILGLLAAALVKGSAGAQISVKFTLDWKFEGPAAPFLVAVDRGYFTAEKLEVTIEPGNGSLEPISRVASGAYDIGFGDINTLIKLRDQKRGAALKAVFMVYNKPPGAIVARKSRGITMPKDLEGKKVGAPARDAAFAQWPIFVQTTGIDARKVTIVDVGFAALEPILADGQVDYDHAIFLGHLCLPSRMADKPAQGLFDKFRDFPSAFREQATALRANAQKWSSWPKQSGLNQNSFYIELDSAIRDLRKIADAFEHLEKQN